MMGFQDWTPTYETYALSLLRSLKLGLDGDDQEYRVMDLCMDSASSGATHTPAQDRTTDTIEHMELDISPAPNTGLLGAMLDREGHQQTPTIEECVEDPLVKDVRRYRN